MRARPAIERFREKIEKRDGCWIWTASTNTNGYGHLRVGASLVSAHRFAYETYVGPIPEGYDIDHRCRNHSCVNPAHLEAVTHRVNVLRGEGLAAQQARQQKCLRGHRFTDENTRVYRGRRVCRTCERKRSTRRRQG